MSQENGHIIISQMKSKTGDIYEPYTKDGDLFIPLAVKLPELTSLLVYDMRIPHNVLKEALEYEPE